MQIQVGNPLFKKKFQYFFFVLGISGQIEPVRPVPKKLSEFSAEEIENFPKFMDFPEEYVIK